MTMLSTDTSPNFRFPGVLNSKELLVAEAIHARAWQQLQDSNAVRGEDEDKAKARLGRIVIKLMTERTASVTEFAAAATAAFVQAPLTGTATR